MGTALSAERLGRSPLLGALAAVAVTACVLVAWLGPKAWDAVRGDRATAADAPLADQCGDVPDAASRLTLTARDGRALGAASVGDKGARTTVVLRHGASQTLCDWLPWADDLAEETGVRVLLFDRRGQGSSPGDDDLTPEPDDVAAAVALARSEGAEEIVLVATSMGNDSTWNALPRIDGEVCAVFPSPPSSPPPTSTHSIRASSRAPRSRSTRTRTPPSSRRPSTCWSARQRRTPRLSRFRSQPTTTACGWSRTMTTPTST